MTIVTTDMMDNRRGYEMACPKCGAVHWCTTITGLISGVVACAANDVLMDQLLNGEPGGAVFEGIRRAGDATE